ncbi:MAG: hydrogenase maturation nickel metallochaperone HypA [Ardenticatenaceae bacterium]|nr:hydrogenase maturation nickel metallochaperone HypA [Anaerolineales bacterium]MCB8977479.1 hydrogenase maturation nickel metallochaperone HypA [Ardenticatenaceae bacterium]
MHELPVTESILKITTEHAARHGATRVTDIYLVIGQLASIVDDSVQFYWDIISANTLCAGAALHFERIPAQLSCLDCHHTYTIPDRLVSCPQCGSIRVQPLAGEEFRVDSISIE